MNNLRLRIIRVWLLAGHRWSAERIERGDLDFDDVLYRTRDATKELLDIYFEGAR